MGRAYAGILGPLAMTVVICRGWIHSSGVEGTLTLATCNLIAFALIGAILGHLAQAAVDESVQAKLQTQLTHHAVPRIKSEAAA